MNLFHDDRGEGMPETIEAVEVASGAQRVLVAGATGYLGKFVTREFKQRGYWVRALTRSKQRLEEPGPFTAPAIRSDEVDDVCIAEATKPETLTGLCEGGIDIVFSSLGISRQRDGLSFEEVDYQANRNLIDLCIEKGVRKFVYVSMLGAEQISDLAITKAHERVVKDLESGRGLRRCCGGRGAKRRSRWPGYAHPT
jgi:uncharacterized protein YbjT (DUF2867 family)